MRIQQKQKQRRRRLAWLASLAIPGTLFIALAAPQATGDELSVGILRVEEDWELVLNEPESADVSPQFFTVISPTGNLDGKFAQIIWNYWEFPEFAPGGLQIQAWDGEHSIDYKSFGQEELSTSAETITWTQSIQTDGDDIQFAIERGSSSTWGNFGGRRLAVLGDLNSNNLNNYNPAISVKNSGITYGANRVQSLAIVRVRRYFEGGMITTDSTKRTIYESE